MKLLPKLSDKLNEGLVDPVKIRLEELNEKYSFDVGSYSDPGNHLDLNAIKKQIIQFKADHSGKVQTAKEIVNNADNRFKVECLDPFLAAMPKGSFGYELNSNRNISSMSEYFQFKVDGDTWNESFSLNLPRPNIYDPNPEATLKAAISEVLSGKSGYINYGASMTSYKSGGVNKLVVLGQVAEWTLSSEFDAAIAAYYTSWVDILIEQKNASKLANATVAAKEANDLINSYVMANFARMVRPGILLDVDASTVDKNGYIDTEDALGIRKGRTLKIKWIKVDKISGRFANITAKYLASNRDYETNSEKEVEYDFEEKVRIEFLLSFFVNHSVQGKFLREDKDLEKLSNSYY